MPCTDRPGLLLDISQILVNWECNIVSVEVDKGALYLECQIAFEEQKPQIMRELQQVVGIYKVSEVFDMPSKERAEQLEAVLASVPDGVLAVNDSGILKHCNKAAANILKLKEGSLEQPLPPDLADSLLIWRMLNNGCSFRNKKIFIESIGRYCMVSARPLRNDINEVVGAVVMICDSRDVREFVQKMTASLPVAFMDIAFASPAMKKVLESLRSGGH
ncbi:PAS domain-containing protein [Sporomusa aerivorans]|uniref:PAS domain-containing protein n=1 Tax=Sporomusa aerivorans TaxID=204936 RepID=UPI00352B9ECF